MSFQVTRILFSYQVAAFSDGHVKVFELLDPIGMTNWQLQVMVLVPCVYLCFEITFFFSLSVLQNFFISLLEIR